MRRILILGATGQLGSELMRACGLRTNWCVKGYSHADLEFTDASAVRSAVKEFRPCAILNCAAYNLVEAAETNPQAAFTLNSAAVANLAVVCREMDSLLVHFSSDFVFDGNSARPYAEDDPAFPLNVYGLSKLSGEQAVRLLHPRHCILRTCGVYGHSRSPGGKLNFVEAILGKAGRRELLRVRDDLVCTPTSASELADAVCPLLEREVVGTFHATNSGSCTWLEFAREILHQAGVAGDVEATGINDKPQVARRPPMSVLCTDKLAAHGVNMSAWKAALTSYIRRRAS